MCERKKPFGSFFENTLLMQMIATCLLLVGWYLLSSDIMGILDQLLIVVSPLLIVLFNCLIAYFFRTGTTNPHAKLFSTCNLIENYELVAGVVFFLASLIAIKFTLLIDDKPYVAIATTFLVFMLVYPIKTAILKSKSRNFFETKVTLKVREIREGG